MESTQRRRRRAGPRLLFRVVACLAVLSLPATFPMASASFSGATATGGSTVSAADLAPPTGLAVTKTCAPGPGIAFRSVATATGLDTVTVPRPAGTAADDLLLAHVAHRQTLRAITAPAGWTLVEHDEMLHLGVTGTAATSAVYWKRATAAEPASATFTLSVGASIPVVGAIAAYTGVHRTIPVDVTGSAVGMGATATTPSVATTVPGTWVVHFLTKRQEVLPAPAGTTGRWALASAASGNAWVGATGAGEGRAAAGATATRTSSASTFESEWVAQTVALRPALGPPSASLSWTASTSSGATGYQVERDVGGTVQNTTTVTPVSASVTTEGPLVDGTTYTFRLRTYFGTWTSPDATIGFTPTC